MKILYEGKLRIIDEIEEDHIHLDDGTVIRSNEIIKLPFVWISKYSQKRNINDLCKRYMKLGSDIEKKLEKLVKDMK